MRLAPIARRLTRVKPRNAAVTVKWGKESYEVDVDTSLPGVVFKTQLFTLSGVPPERQKIMGCKNAPLKASALRSAARVSAR